MTKYTRKADSLTKDEINLISRVIERVWNNIAPEITDIEEIDNEAAIESCLDANYPSTFCGEDGKKVEALHNEFAYGEIEKFFTKRIRLA